MKTLYPPHRTYTADYFARRYRGLSWNLGPTAELLRSDQPSPRTSRRTTGGGHCGVNPQS